MGTVVEEDRTREGSNGKDWMEQGVAFVRQWSTNKLS